jgi:hypothetical protein
MKIMACNITVAESGDYHYGLRQFCVQMEPHSAKRQKNSVDYENVILALPAEFPSPSKKKRPHTAGKKGQQYLKKLLQVRIYPMHLCGPLFHGSYVGKLNGKISYLYCSL